MPNFIRLAMGDRCRHNARFSLGGLNRQHNRARALFGAFFKTLLLLIVPEGAVVKDKTGPAGWGFPRRPSCLPGVGGPVFS